MCAHRSTQKIIMATAQELDVDDDGSSFIPRAPPPSPEVPHAGTETYFDFSSIQFLDNNSEPSSPTPFHHHSPLNFSSLEEEVTKARSLYPTSPPHDIPHGVNGLTSHHHSHFCPTFTSSSVPINFATDYHRHLPHSLETPQLPFMELPESQTFRQRKISLKRNHDDLSDDCCYNSSGDPSWVLVETPPSESGHKKACQERDAAMSLAHTSPNRHKKLSVPSRLPGRVRDQTTPPPLVSRFNHLSIGKSVPQVEKVYDSSWHGNAGPAADVQLMDCSESASSTVVVVTSNDSNAMDCGSADHPPFSLTTPSPSHLTPTTRSHTFSFSPTPSSPSSFLNPNSLSPYTNQGWQPSSPHQFFSSFHEQSPLPDGSINMLSRSL